MHFFFSEADAIARTAIDAAERAAAIAVRRVTTWQIGQRVHFQLGAGEWLYGTVWELTLRADEVCAWLLVPGGNFHCEPVANLHRVCGVCPDCRALNQRPGCME